MAKFCGNCGSKLDDHAKVCGQCGVPVSGASAEGIPGLKIVDLEKQKKIKKSMKLFIGLVVFVFVAVIVFDIASKYTGYNGLLRKTMASYEDYDIDTLISLSSDMYYYGEDNEAEKYFEQTVGDDLNYFEASVGHRYKVSYEVNETYVMSERKTDELLDQVESMYTDFDVSVIEKIVVADLTLMAKQDEKSVELNKNIIMTKEDGKWKLLYME